MKNKNMSSIQKQLWLLCLLPMLSVFIFNYIPMFGIIIAFKNYKYQKGIFGSAWNGFDNFKFFFSSNEFTKITRNTIGLNLIFIIASIFCAVAIAILLFDLTSRNKTKVFQTILITPYFISWVIVSYMVYALLNPEFGIINNLLQSMGMNKILWYSEAKYWPVILTVSFVWKSVGMDCIVYYASLMGIDSTLFEAAEIDGASKLRKTWSITIPSLIPLITVLTIMKIGNIFRADFGLFYQVTRNVGVLYETTDVIDTYIFRSLRTSSNMGISAAVGLLQSVVGFVLVVITNTSVKRINPDNALF